MDGTVTTIVIVDNAIGATLLAGVARALIPVSVVGRHARAVSPAAQTSSAMLWIHPSRSAPILSITGDP